MNSNKGKINQCYGKIESIEKIFHNLKQLSKLIQRRQRNHAKKLKSQFIAVTPEIVFK